LEDRVGLAGAKMARHCTDGASVKVASADLPLIETA
jgi:hypothetical protein